MTMVNRLSLGAFPDWPCWISPPAAFGNPRGLSFPVLRNAIDKNVHMARPGRNAADRYRVAGGIHPSAGVNDDL